MQLALGTVQFGLRYGVAGHRVGPVPEAEVRSILARAAALGIRTLDTAAAYGDIEARLAGLADGLDFEVVSKLPPVPPELAFGDVAGWVDAAVQRAHSRLGPALHALMFHRAEDLLEARADALWAAAQRQAAARGFKLGVSCYDADTLARVRARHPVTIAQLPGNAIDQRLRHAAPISPDLELHLRSAFLQGLLLMPEAAAAQRVPRAAAALARWHAWCRDHALDALPAALGFVKGLPGVSHCVVGVDDLAQLEAIAAAWQGAPVLHADALDEPDLDVIDPRRWPAQP